MARRSAWPFDLKLGAEFVLLDLAFFIALAIGPSGTGSGIISAEGGGGRGLSNTVLNSLKRRSSPGCICLAIMGKLFNKSLKVLMSFFGRVLLDVFDSRRELVRGGKGGLPFGDRVGNNAGMILISSYIPNNGLDM
jgi:hypothetical protein